MTTWTILTNDDTVLRSRPMYGDECLTTQRFGGPRGVEAFTFTRAEATALLPVLAAWVGACLPESITRAAGILALQGGLDAACARMDAASRADAPSMLLVASVARDAGEDVSPPDIQKTNGLLGDPDAPQPLLPTEGPVEVSVLEYCLAEEAQRVEPRVVTPLHEQSLKEQLIAWRIPACGRYADHAEALARQSGGRYPVHGEEVTHGSE